MKPKEKGQVYHNQYGLIIVPQCTDPGGQPRPPLNLILHYILVQKVVPPGYILWEPSCYHDQAWLQVAPEYCYIEERYQLNRLLRYLDDLGVQDFETLAPLVYAADHGCLSNPVMQRIMRSRKRLYDNGHVTEDSQKACVKGIIDFIVDNCGYHYGWDPDVLAESRAQQALEDAELTVKEWEARENPMQFPYVVRAQDRQGKYRSGFLSIYNSLKADRMPAGFTPNRKVHVRQDLKWWLRAYPEYTLTDCYNLQQLVDWLNNLSLSVAEKMAVIYASDYGYTDNAMYIRTKNAALASWVNHRRAYLLAGFKEFPPEDIIACGPTATREFREEFYRGRKK